MKHKNGFTLVELSIVLVIIGLLIGGILIGQTMIESSKVQSQLRQLQQFEIAVNKFELKFNSFPGDSDVFTPNGDMNGAVESDSGSHQPFNGEISAFWKHMSDSGFQPDGVTYSDDASSGLEVEVHIPKAILGTKTTGVIFYEASGLRRLYLADAVNSTNAGWPGQMSPGVSVANSLALDVKLDDGDASTGDVISNCDGTLAYDFDTAENCRVFIKFGLSTYER